MKKILSIDIIDIIPYVNGILFVRKEEIDENNIKVTFFSYDVREDSMKAVPKSVYLLNKFGSIYESVAHQLGDYVSCEAGILPGNSAFVIYPSGEMGLFSPKGELLKSGELNYHGSPARSVAVENNHIWCAVPKENCIVRYSTTAEKIVMRIGSENTDTFANPSSLCINNGALYVCNGDSMKISKVDLNTFAVSDYLCFDEKVYSYMVGCNKEIVVLESGVYML